LGGVARARRANGTDSSLDDDASQRRRDIG
jgi:hypothetical protein